MQRCLLSAGGCWRSLGAARSDEQAYADTLGPQIDNPLTPDEWMTRLATLPLVDQPGSQFRYGHATDLLGFCWRASMGRRSVRCSSGGSSSRSACATSGFAVAEHERHRRAARCGFDADGQMATLVSTPGGHAGADRPRAMTFESGGQGLWSTLDDYLAFARTLIGCGAGGLSLLRRRRWR